MPSSALLAHGDKAILTAFFLMLTGAAANLVTGAEHEATRLELEGSLATVREHAAARAPVTVSGAPPWAAALRRELAVPPPTPAPFPDWIGERRPAFVFDLVPLPQPPAFAHSPPTGVTADASERGRVVVRWQAGAVQHLLVSHTVERRRGDDGAWETIGAVAAPVTELVDTSTDPRAAYAYRVVATATVEEGDPTLELARRAGTFVALDPTLVRRESDPSAPVLTPAELFVVPLSVSAGQRPDQATAYVVMHRWDRVAGRFVSTRLQVKVEQRLVVEGFDSGLVVEEISDQGALRITLRAPSGELLIEDSRRDRLPADLRGRQ